MAFLTIAGVDYDVVITGAGRPENIEVGGRSRAFAGNLRSSVRAEKRVWEYTLQPLSVAARDTLRTNIANGAFVTVAGTLLGGSLTANVRITREEQIPDGADATIFKSVCSVHIEEV